MAIVYWSALTGVYEVKSFEFCCEILPRWASGFVVPLLWTRVWPDLAEAGPVRDSSTGCDIVVGEFVELAPAGVAFVRDF